MSIALAVTGGCNNEPADTQPTSAASVSYQPEETDAQPDKSGIDAHVYIEGTKFMVGGKEIWFSGVNTPWIRWNDFCGQMDDTRWEQTFAELAEDHINCTRIWVNCNGTDIVELDPLGYPESVNPAHWTDLEKLFALAEKYKVYVMPTLLSFDHFKGLRWQELLADKELCDRYADTYVAEFCERFGGCDYIMGIDIMNEPDWVNENDECGKMSWDNISYLLGKCADVIHSKCDKPVTVGTAMIKYNSERVMGNKVSDEYLKELTGLDGAYLDFYSMHYYNWQKPYWGFPCSVTPEEYGLETDRPCMIGETSNDDLKETRMTLTEKYMSMYEKGWNGLLVWMEPRTNEEMLWSGYDLTREATNAMYEYAPEKIDPLGVWGTEQAEAA